VYEACVALLLLAALNACTNVSKASSNGPAPETITHISSVSVAQRAMPQLLSLTGTLLANRSSQVAADGAGRVQTTAVDRGSYVQKGGLLVALDARSARFTQAEARAQAAALVSQRDQAQRDCERAERLLSDRVIGQAEYDRLKSQCSAAEWSSTAAAARTDLADKALGDAAVRAPFAGMIVERFVSLGEYVRAGTPVASLVEIDPLRLALTVPESQIGHVRVGQKVHFEVTAFSGEQFTGSLVRRSPAVRADSRDLVVEAEIPNPDHRLLPGMFALARIELDRVQKPVLPAAALRSDGPRKRIFALVDGRLEERLVQVGESEDALVAIEKGVTPGERVASPMTPELKDGLKVE
jgi:membrane fusion protein (multidrug efflux system)